MTVIHAQKADRRGNVLMWGVVGVQKEAVLAAFRAGAPGVILSRKYSEMRLANLSGAGDAIRELKL